jgi:excisionase family DNA binding protein
MFYSMKEAAETLNVTEDKIKELVQDGRLREFRDGPNLLFKVDEVQSLLSDPSLSSPTEKETVAETPEAEAPEAETAEAETTEAETTEAEATEAEAAEVEAEPIEESASKDLDTGTGISLELEADDTVTVDSPALEPPEEGETAVEETKKADTDEAAESEIFLASTGSGSELSELTSQELTSGDTALTSEGVNVLGETDSEYQVAEDTKGETQEITAEEPSLEQIEEDVNLDSFGSGSGLLDLSLQADDTSLGGILDDIYMSEGEEGQEAAPVAVEGSAMQMAAEAEQIMDDVTPDAAIPAAPGVMPAYIEPQADTTTTILLMITLLISFAVAIYTAVVVLSKSAGSMLQGLFMYVLIGCFTLSVVFGFASLVTGGSKTKTKKPKAKKEKKVKPKKEKKKKEKPKKEKKKKEKKKK